MTSHRDVARERLSQLHRPIRGKTTLSHAVYGLILMVAALGELFEARIQVSDAALVLLAGGGALLLIHVYSSSLGMAAVSETRLSWRTVAEQFVSEAPVSLGFAAALIVLVMMTAVGIGLTAAYVITGSAALLALGLLGGLAVVRRPTFLRRAAVGVMTAGMGVAVIALERAFV